MPSRKKAQGRRNRARKEATRTADLRSLWEPMALCSRSNHVSNHEAVSVPREHTMTLPPKIPREGPTVSFMNFLAGEGFFDMATQITCADPVVFCFESLSRFPRVQEEESERSLAIDLLLRFLRNVFVRDSAMKVEKWFNQYHGNDVSICCMIYLLELFGAYSDSVTVVVWRACKLCTKLAGGNRRDVAKFVSKRLPCTFLKGLHRAVRKKLAKVGLAAEVRILRPRRRSHVPGDVRLAARTYRVPAEPLVDARRVEDVPARQPLDLVAGAVLLEADAARAVEAAAPSVERGPGGRLPVVRGGLDVVAAVADDGLDGIRLDDLPSSRPGSRSRSRTARGAPRSSAPAAARPRPRRGPEAGVGRVVPYPHHPRPSVPVPRQGGDVRVSPVHPDGPRLYPAHVVGEHRSDAVCLGESLLPPPGAGPVDHGPHGRAGEAADDEAGEPAHDGPDDGAVEQAVEDAGRGRDRPHGLIVVAVDVVRWTAGGPVEVERVVVRDPHAAAGK
ncbi:hypothetical protein THAOC_16858, partial [Thalassiosira oceanica]